MKGLVVAAVLSSLSALAGEAEWETVLSGPITVKNRAREGTSIKEVWAEGDIDAPVQDIQQTLMTPGRFKHFMPNLKDSREIGTKEADGSVYVYTELDLPVVTSRDYVVRVWLDEGVKPDGTGNFRNHWTAVPNKIPERRSLVRVQVDDGSWVVTPKGDGSKSHAVYKFAVDPGGWVPSFAANMGNSQAVPETFKAVEKESQRRKAERLKAAGTAPAAPAIPAGILPSASADAGAK